MKFKNPHSTTDIIIEHNDGEKEGIVIIKRKNPPIGLAIPGGFAEWGLSLEENAVKEAKEETNLDVVLYNPERPLCVHSKPCRDPRTHVITAVYVGRGYGELKAGDDAKKAYLYTLSEVEQLIKETKSVKTLLRENLEVKKSKLEKILVFDHDIILEKYFVKLKAVYKQFPDSPDAFGIKEEEIEKQKVEWLKLLWSL